MVPDTSSAHVPGNYSKESTEWVKDILTIQQVGSKDCNKNTFTGFAVQIFNPLQLEMVLHHIAASHAISPLLHTIYTFKIGKAATVNIFEPKIIHIHI